jgi:hypothetical protein
MYQWKIVYVTSVIKYAIESRVRQSYRRLSISNTYLQVLTHLPQVKALLRLA